MAEGPACGGGPSRAPVLQTGRGLRRAGPRGKHRDADPPFFGIVPRNWQIIAQFLASCRSLFNSKYAMVLYVSEAMSKTAFRSYLRRVISQQPLAPDFAFVSFVLQICLMIMPIKFDTK